MARVFVGIGSNEGDRLALILRAVKALETTPGVRVVALALIQETEPVGGPPQGRFLNTVVELETTLEPRTLLGGLQTIEQRLGRRPSSQRWAPRPLDLDLLLYEDRRIEEPELTVPHPRLHERRFVLEPLAQLAPDLRHPILGQTMAELRDGISGARPPRHAEAGRGGEGRGARER